MPRFNILVLSYLFRVFLLCLGLTKISEASHGPEYPHAHFVIVKNAHFVLNGKPFLFNGFNAYWMMSVATDPNDRHKVSEVFKDAFAAGLSVCRIWAFSDGGDYNPLQISPGNYNERAFQALDFVISEARKYRIRLILSFVNNWSEYGGKPQYTRWGQNAGQQTYNEDDFYTNAVLKEYYKNHVKKVVTRVNTMTGVAYKNDPIIMAWELINEPRCEADLSGRTVNGWVQEMAAFVKSLDDKHLLEVGLEGFYGDTIKERKRHDPHSQLHGTDFIANNLNPNIDFATIHAYPYQWLNETNDGIVMAWMQKWMTIHWQDSVTILKKPLVLAEFGKSSREVGYTLSERETYMRGVYRTTYNLAKHGGIMGGSLVWQIMAKGMETYYDGNEILFSEPPSTTEIIAGQSKAMSKLSHLVTL